MKSTLKVFGALSACTVTSRHQSAQLGLRISPAGATDGLEGANFGDQFNVYFFDFPLTRQKPKNDAETATCYRSLEETAPGTMPKSKSARLGGPEPDRELCTTKWHPSYSSFTFWSSSTFVRPSKTTMIKSYKNPTSNASIEPLCH